MKDGGGAEEILNNPPRSREAERSTTALRALCRSDTQRRFRQQETTKLAKALVVAIKKGEDASPGRYREVRRSDARIALQIQSNISPSREKNFSKSEGWSENWICVGEK